MRLCYALLLPLPAFAAGSAADLAERAVQLDQVTQALKDEAVELGREVGLVESAVNAPEHQRLTIYLRVDIAGLLLHEAQVALDDRPAEIIRYNDVGARALLADHSSQQLLTLATTPGAHRIELSFRGKFSDDADNAPPIINTYRAVFDKAPDDPAELAFVIGRASRFSNDIRVDLIQLRSSQ